MSSMSWYAAYTEANREALAARELRAKGLEVYCPFREVRRRQKVRAVGGRWSPAAPRFRLVTRQEPVFSRYIFVRAAGMDELGRARGARGVAGLVMSGQDYVRIADREMAGLMSRADARGCVAKEDRAAFLGKPGDLFNFGKNNKMLAGLLGVIRDVAGVEATGLVKAELIIFGRATPVEVRVDHIEQLRGPGKEAEAA